MFVENISELIQDEKLKLCQLTGTDSAEIVVLFTNPKISSLLENEYWEGFQQFLTRD